MTDGRCLMAKGGWGLAVRGQTLALLTGVSWRKPQPPKILGGC